MGRLLGWAGHAVADGGFAEVAGAQQVAPAAQLGGGALEHEPAVAEHVGAVGDLERELRRAARRTARRRRAPRRRGAGSAAAARRSRARARGSSRRRAARAGAPTSARPTASICCSPPDSTPALRSRHLRSSGSSSSSSASRRRLPLRLGELQVLADGQAEEQRAALGHERRRRGARACGRGCRRVSSPSSATRAAERAAAGRRSWTASSSCRRRWARAARPPRRRRRGGRELAHDRRRRCSRRTSSVDREQRRGQASARLVRVAAEVGGDRPSRRCGSAAGVPLRDDAGRSRAPRPGRRRRARAPCRGRRAGRVTPCARAARAGGSPSSTLSSVSSPAAGSSSSTSRGRWASARATPTSLRRPWRELGGQAVATSVSPQQLERPVDGVARVLPDRQQQVAQRRRHAHALAGDEQVLLDGEVVEQLDATGRCARGRGGRAGAGAARVMSSPSKVTVPRDGRVVAGQRVDRRRLAGAVGADQADDRAASTSGRRRRRR